MTRVALCVVLALVTACASHPPPITPDPPRILIANISIRTVTGQPIETAAGTLTVDAVEGSGAVVTATGGRQAYRFVEGPTARPGWGATLLVQADGYQPGSYRVVIPDGAGELPEAILEPVPPPV